MDINKDIVTHVIQKADFGEIIENLIKEGKGHKDVFLKEAKTKFPNMINRAATYDQAPQSCVVEDQ